MRQISFAALVVGLMGDNDDIINPVVVLSCIFMEDKRLEMQADGILNRVIIRIVECIFYCYNNQGRYSILHLSRSTL